jgi:hypothetical protein
MKTFQEFVLIAEAAYDAEVMSRSQIRKTGEGGRIGAERKKTAPEKRRMSQAKPGEERKPTDYKARKDIGSQRQASTRVQQPTQERGSADVKAKAADAAKEERKKAALARIAAKKKGGEAPAAEKPKAKEATKTASQLLKTKKTEVDKRPSDQPKRAVVGMSREKRKEITRSGHRKLETLVRQSEAEKQGKKPEQVQLKHDYTPK